MDFEKNGLTVSIEHNNNEFVLTLKTMRDLKHRHYKVMGGIIEAAFDEFSEPRVKVFTDTGSEDGWELSRLHG